MRIEILLRTRHLRSIVGSLLVLFVCTACSDINVGAVKVAYHHADWLSQRAIAHYVELSDGQQQALRVQLDRLHRWHRTHELPMYADLLDDAAGRVARRLTPADGDWVVGVMEARRQTLMSHVAEELSPVVITLTPQQRAQIASNFARENARYARRGGDLSREETVDARTAWLAHQLERWTGDLTPEQRARVRIVNAATPELPEVRLAERRRRQENFLQLVGIPREEPQLKAALTSLLTIPRAGASEEYRRAVARYQEELSHMLLDIDGSLSSRQRTSVVTRLHHFARELRELAAEPS